MARVVEREYEIRAAWRVPPAEQERRERLRLETAGRFARGESTAVWPGSPVSSAAGARTCFYAVHVYRGQSGEAKSFSWRRYRDLIIATHEHLGAPPVWCWDNLNVRLVQELADFAEENKVWLRVVRLPTYAPELNAG